MKEMLKEYRLYSDLVRLNNDDYFQVDFRTPDIEDVFSNISNRNQYLSDQSCLFFLHNLKICDEKHVYLAIKWLIVTHRLINLTQYFKVVEMIYASLSEMTSPILKNNYQKYLYETLVKVYVQYLQKLCILRLKEHAVDCYPDNQEQANELTYLRFNLLRFASKEFKTLIPEFGGFFRQEYPFLVNYAKLIENDLRDDWKQLKGEHRRQDEKLIPWSQLEIFEEQLQTIAVSNPTTPGKDNYLVETDISPYKIEAFLKSNTKELGHTDLAVHSFE